jgi:hypothetical protein
MGRRTRGSQRAHFSLGSLRAHAERAPIYVSGYFDYIYDYFDYIYNYFDYNYDYFDYVYAYFLVATSTTP